MTRYGNFEEEDFEILKNEMEETGLQLVELRGQPNDPKVLRVPRMVGFMPFNFSAPDTEFTKAYRDGIANMLSTVTNACDGLTIGIYIHDGVSSFYWFTKGAPFTDQRFRGVMKSLNAGEPIPILDPFGVMDSESVVARRIVKGSLSGAGMHRAGGFFRSFVGDINYDIDMYYLFDGEPVGDLMGELVRMAVGESMKPDLHESARFYVTFQFRRVMASSAGEMEISRKFKRMEPDPKKKLGVPQGEYAEHMRLRGELKRRFPGGIGIQVEAQVMLVYPRTMSIEDATSHVEAVVPVAVNNANAVSYSNADIPGRSTLSRSQLRYGIIPIRNAVRYYVTGTFLKGKEEYEYREGKGKDAAFPPPEDYHMRRNMLPRGVAARHLPGTEGFDDRAVSLADAAYFFPIIGKSTLSRMRVSPDPGSCIFFPFYVSLYKRMHKKMPSNLETFEQMHNQKDFGFDSRYVSIDEYVDFMRRIHVPMYRNPAVAAGKGPAVSDSGGQHDSTPHIDTNGFFPIEADDIKRLFSDRDMKNIERFRGSDSAVLGVVRPLGEFPDITGPSARPGEGFRGWVSGGSGSGKSTVGATLAVEGQANGYTVIVPAMNPDIVNKVFKILIDRYGNIRNILDRVEFVTAGDNQRPSIHSMNILHLSIPGLDNEGRYSIVLHAGTAGREAQVDDAMIGFKILQHLKNFILAFLGTSPDSTLVDILNCLDEPGKCKDTLMSKSERSGAKRNSAVESAITSLEAQVRNPRSEEFASTRRFLDGLVGTMFLKRMLNDRGARFDFSDFLMPDRPKIVFVYCPYPAVTEENAVTEIAGFIELIYMRKLALNQLSDGKRFPDAEGIRRLTYRDGKLLIIADEFQKYWNEGLKTIVTQGRKEGVSVVLLTQDFMVKGSNNRPIYDELRGNFNFKLFRDVTNADQVKFLGLSDTADVQEVLSAFRDINGKTGLFYLDGTGVKEHRVSTLYDISENRPEFMDAIINAAYKRYEELDEADGKGRLRMLTDEDVEEMSRPVEAGRNFTRLCVLEAMYYLNDIKNSKVSVHDIIELAKGMARRSAALRTAVSQGGEGLELFAQLTETQVNEALSYFIEDHRIQRWGEKVNNVYVYRILESGISLLRESLGVGTSGGGDEHRDYEMRIAKAVMESTLVDFEEGRAEGRGFVFLNLNARAGPDLQIDLTACPIERKFGGTITKLQVEVEMQYHRENVLNKINALPNGWHLVFYVQPGLVGTFRTGINSIKENELVGGSVDVIVDRVAVRSLAEVDRSLSEFYKNLDGRGAFMGPDNGDEKKGGDEEKEGSRSEDKERVAKDENADSGRGTRRDVEQEDRPDECSRPLHPRGSAPEERFRQYLDSLERKGIMGGFDTSEFYNMKDDERKIRLCKFLAAISRPGVITKRFVDINGLWRLMVSPSVTLVRELFGIPDDIPDEIRDDYERNFLKMLLQAFVAREFGTADELDDEHRHQVCGNRFFYGGTKIGGAESIDEVDGKDEGMAGFYLVNPAVVDPKLLCQGSCSVDGLGYIDGLYVEDAGHFTGVPEEWLDFRPQPSAESVNNADGGKASEDAAAGGKPKAAGPMDDDTAQIINGIRNAIDAIIANPPKGIEIIPSISEIKDTQERAEAAIRVAVTTGYFYAINQGERSEDLRKLVAKDVYVPVDETRLLSFSRVYVRDYNTNLKRAGDYLRNLEASEIIIRPWSKDAKGYRPEYQYVVGKEMGVYFINIGRFPLALSPEIYKSDEALKGVVKVVAFIGSLLDTFHSLLD
ncbi:MAG: hypothetical protein ACP5NO_07620, partial [Thermoplasmata archaeon]